MKKELLSSMIVELDQKHNETIANQQTPKGNNLEVRNIVAGNMVIQRNYEVNRKKLVEMLNDTTPLSNGVEQFLSSQRIFSKFDVDSGAVKIDNSLNPLGGKNF